MRRRLVITGATWVLAAVVSAWTVSLLARFDRAVEGEVARAKDRASYIWRSQVGAGITADSASADVLAVVARELSGGARESVTRLPFAGVIDEDALWASYYLDPIRDRMQSQPRTPAESLSLRVARSKFNKIFRDNRPYFEQVVQERVRTRGAFAGGLIALAVLLTLWTARSHRRWSPMTALALLALLAGAGTMVGAQQRSYSIRGIVRSDGDNRPLSGASIELTGTRFSRQVRSDEAGRFSIGSVPTGRYTLAVLRLGYQPISQTVAVGDADAQLTITMTGDPAQLNTIVTRANVTAVYGGIGAVGSGRNAAGEREMTAAAGAKIQVMGSRKSISADSLGRFFLELDKPGLYMVRVSGPGLAPQMFPVEVPRNKAVEVSRMMDSVRMTSPTGREYLFDEMDRRVGWRSMNSALVTGSELRNAGGSLSEALLRSKSMTLRGLRLGSSTCVFLNGVPRPGLPLDAFQIEEIEAVELYGERGDPSGTLAASWPVGAQCGLSSRRGAPQNSAIAVPDAKWAVIWTQRP